MTDNFECRVVNALGPAFPKWIPHAHISHFAPQSLERLLLGQGLEITRRLSYTPWELHLRALVHRLQGADTTPAKTFDLERTLATEMGGRYRLFRLRRRMNRIWARLSARPSLEGALMYALARRPP
jgi:hypothetical protein